jgi:hypothetical protein
MQTCLQTIALVPERADITAFYGDTLRSRFAWLIPGDVSLATFTLKFRDQLLGTPVFLTMTNADLLVGYDSDLDKTKVSMRNLTVLEEAKWRESLGFVSYTLKTQLGTDIRTRFGGFFKLTDRLEDCPTDTDIEGHVIGIKGDTGQDGSSLAATFTRIAGETLGGHRLVWINNNQAFYASADEVSAELVSGITTGAVSSGALATIQSSGEIEEPSWSWAEGVVYLGLNGQLTQTPPTTHVNTEIGVALAATKLLVRVQRAIYLL